MPFNPEVAKRIKDEQSRNMILEEEENNRIADYLNTIEQYGMRKRSKGIRSKGKRSKGKRSKGKRSKKRSGKKKSKKIKKI